MAPVMPNELFSELRAELREAVDETFGEEIQLLPLDRERRDRTRSQDVFIAVHRTGEREDAPLDVGTRRASRAGVASSGGYLRIDRDIYPDLIIRKGDKVRALERRGQPIWRVEEVDDRSHLRLIVELGDV